MIQENGTFLWPPYIDPHLQITLSEAQEEEGRGQADSPRVFSGLIRFDADHVSALIEAGMNFPGEVPRGGNVLTSVSFTRDALDNLSKIPDIHRIVLSISDSRPTTDADCQAPLFVDMDSK